MHFSLLLTISIKRLVSLRMRPFMVHNYKQEKQNLGVFSIGAPQLTVVIATL